MNKNEHNKNSGSNLDRQNERIKLTGEVFTPAVLCKKMVDSIPEEYILDPSNKFIDDSAGSGNFLIALKDRLLEFHSEEHIINNMLYCVELMEDNHVEICKRLGVNIDHPHFVCANALEYDYGFGDPVALENHLGKMEDKKPYVVQPVKHEPSQAVLPF